MRITNALVDGNGRSSLFTVSALDGSTPIINTGVSLTNANAAHVAIVDGSGNQITSFGGGTQYTDGNATVAHPIGTMPVYDNAGTISKVSVANGLPIQPATGASFAVTGTFWQATQPVSGTVTANAGTGTFNIQSNASVNVSQYGGNAVASAGQNGVFSIGGNQATNNNVSTNAYPVLIAGSDYGGTPKIQSMKVDSSGKQYVSTVDTVTTVTTVTTVSAVTAISNALPAGTNTLGSVKLTDGTNTAGVTTSSSLKADITTIAGNAVSTAASGVLLVGIADGAGNKITTNSSTYTAKFALDANILGVLGTAFTDAGKVNVQGDVASGSSDAGKPVKLGAYAVNAEPSAVTNGQRVNLIADLTGKLITSPHANKENFISGVGTATGTSGTSVISAQGAGVKIYVTSISIANTGSSTSLITIQSDPAGTPSTLWYLINPAGGGDNITFDPPLVVPANKAVGFTAGTGSTTQYVSISGYIGS